MISNEPVMLLDSLNITYDELRLLEYYDVVRLVTGKYEENLRVVGVMVSEEIPYRYRLLCQEVAHVGKSKKSSVAEK